MLLWSPGRKPSSFYNLYHGSLLRESSGRVLSVAIHHHLVMMLRMSRALPPLLLYVFMSCISDDNKTNVREMFQNLEETVILTG